MVYFCEAFQGINCVVDFIRVLVNHFQSTQQLLLKMLPRVGSRDGRDPVELWR